jgi:alpha-tubulin suppressor-like RCC1 family protein
LGVPSRRLLALISLAACTPRGGEPPKPQEVEVVEAKDPEPKPETPPRATEPLTGITLISPGVHHTCALEGGRVSCWGLNRFDMLGVGPGLPDPVLEPRPVIGLEQAGPIVKVETDYDFSCALAQSGDVYCWGDNDQGQLGVGDQVRRDRPTQVAGVRAGLIYVNFGQVCAVAPGSTFGRRTAWCWGTGAFGGGPVRHFESKPVEIAALANVGQLAYNCWLRDDAVRCWGHNSGGQVGNGEGGCEYDEPLCSDCRRLPDRTCKYVDKPTAPLGLPAVEQIAGGGHYNYAVDYEGGVWEWGQVGQTMSYDPRPNYRPQRVADLPPIVQISAGGSHVCALDEDGQLWCWGNNSFGQLGFENAERQSSEHPKPNKVEGLPPVRQIRAGFYFTCALTGEGEGTQAWCWGDNGSGQLGDGTTERRHVPTLVKGRG